MQADYLFVYGSLRRGSSHPMQLLLANHSRYCGHARFQGKLYDLEGYPGAISSDDPQDRVQGDLLQITSHQLLEQLDSYEGVGSGFTQPNEYLRQVVRIASASAGNLKAWIYLYNRTVAKQRQIHSGDYLSDRETRKKS